MGNKTGKKLTVAAVGILISLGTWIGVAQLKIVSFNSSGNLAWTNHTYVGQYAVERADSPLGPWQAVDWITDTNAATTNRISYQAQLTNSAGFIRLNWVKPNALGVWTLQLKRGSEMVMTGALTISAAANIENPDTFNPLFQVTGTRVLRSVGHYTNEVATFFLGEGPFDGVLEVGTMTLHSYWPNNASEGFQMSGTIVSNSYSGFWVYGIPTLGGQLFGTRE